MSEFLIIDTFTIVAAAAVVVVAVLSALFSPFFRFKQSWREEDVSAVDDDTPAEADTSALPKLSVILSPHDEAEKLAENLPLLLRQKYPAGYQVIVVIEQGEHDTEDVIKRMQMSLDNGQGDSSLYMTYIPDSSRYMSRKKLAMTLGVKAAKTEWVLFTEGYTKPDSEYWLQAMARHCADSVHTVIGYGRYAPETSAFKRFERLNTAYYLMREDVTGTAYTTLSHNLMLRKSDFMQLEGFRSNLNLIRGEYDFLVNDYAPLGDTALVTNPQAWVTDDVPTYKSWLNKHIMYAETRKWLQRSGSHRAWFNADQTALYVGLAACVAGVAYGVAATNVIILAASILAFIVSVVVRTVSGHKAMKAFGEHVPAILIYPYELSLPWRNLRYLLKHRLADKLDFTTHKQ